MNEKAKYNCFVCYVVGVALLFASGYCWIGGDTENCKNMAIFSLFFFGAPVVIWLSWKIDP